MKNVIKMKKNVIIVLLALLIFSCNQKKEAPKNVITIEGKVKFPDDRFKMMIYRYKNFKKEIIDSFTVKKDGSYYHEMEVKEPGTYMLDCQKWQNVWFWAEDENLKINFRGQDTAKIKIKNPPYVYIEGGKNNEVINLINFNDYRNYQLMIQSSQAIYKNLKDHKEIYKKIIGENYNMLSEESKERIKFIAETYSDRKSVLMALSRLNSQTDSSLINKVLANLLQIYPQYEPAIKFKEEREAKLEKKRRVQIGQQAPTFSYKTKENKPVSISDFKGNYLVIDFWASWCGPCRKEIPNLIKAYNKYNNKGVKFLSVSIDSKEKDWLKALDEEKMPWTQIRTDDSGAKVMDDYQFNGIPFIILLDKEGKFKAKYLRGESLDKILKELVLKK